jgi:hypothetical protein
MAHTHAAFSCFVQRNVIVAVVVAVLGPLEHLRNLTASHFHHTSASPCAHHMLDPSSTPPQKNDFRRRSQEFEYKHHADGTV